MQQPEISIHPLIGRLRFIGETNGSDKNYSFSIFTEKPNDTVHFLIEYPFSAFPHFFLYIMCFIT